MQHSKFLTSLCISFCLITFSIAHITDAHAADSAGISDIDGNGEIKPLSDGLLLLRYLFGFRGNALIDNAVGLGATRKTPPEIEDYIGSHLNELDIDGNGEIKPLSDGLLLLRYLFGFRGNALIDNAIGLGATRTTISGIESHMQKVSFFVNTLSTDRCTSYGLATYSFFGGITGTGTISVQPYSEPGCKGFKNGPPIVDTLTYYFENISFTTTGATADMTIITANYGSRSRRVNIQNGIVTL